MSPLRKNLLAFGILVAIIFTIWTIEMLLTLCRPVVMLRMICLGLVIAGLIVLVLSMMAYLAPVAARDLGQWQNTNPIIHKWYQELMRPDAPGSPCCTEADAYWADEFFVKDGKMFARITDDRPDGPLGRPHIDNGSEFEVPQEKLKYSDGNPTGHGVLFVSTAGWTWCYVMPGGV